MFTRRTLFKMLAAVGAGLLLPAVGEGGVDRFSGLDEALPFDISVRAGRSRAPFGAQPVDVTTIEQWENLLDDLDAVELIGRYVSLEPASADVSRITGRCPFCRHGTDSLLVDGRDDSYFCTECLGGGHVLDFYAQMERCALPDGISQLRALLARGQLKGKRLRMDRLWRLIDETRRFAREALVHSREGESALTWLDRQAVTPATVEDFSLGLFSCGLGKQLVERLRTMGFSPDELEQAGVDGWLSCKEDRVRNGEQDSVLLLSVRDREGHCWGFYEQPIEADADFMWSSYFSPYGLRLLSPHRADRLVFSAFNGQDLRSSVVLVERPWDVVLLAQGGMDQAIYVTLLDFAEYRNRLDKFLMCTRTVIWPIHQSELNVGFLRQLFSLPSESIARLTFLLLPEGESLPGLLRREGIGALQARLAGAISVKELVGG